MDDRNHPHPLLARDIRTTGSWQEWKEQWKKEGQSEIVLDALIGRGWSAKVETPEEKVERILLYLDLADGHLSPAYLSKEGETRDLIPVALDTLFGTVMGMAEVRQTLAEKAFQTLCMMFFKKPDDAAHHHPIPWMEHCGDARVFRKIMWFLRAGERGSLGKTTLVNLPDIAHPDNRHHAVFHGFVLKFIERTWGQGDEAELEESRIAVLSAIGRIDLLLDEEHYPLRHAGYVRLREVALSEKLKFPGEKAYRSPASLEEASCMGSRTAQICLLLGAHRSERRRMRGITADGRKELKAA